MSGGASLLADAKLFELSPDHVDEGDRIGFLHDDKAAALGRLMAVDGQRDPIKVRANPKNPEKPWRLVTGMHRLIGARIECITVFAIEVSGKPEDMADLEASENIHRRPLAPIERAKFTTALVQAARDRLARENGDLSQQKLAAKARWDRVKSGECRVEEALNSEADDAHANLARAYGWEESAVEALGISRRSIHRDLELYRLLIEPFPDLAEPLSRHPVVGENASQLKLIAQVKDEKQRRAVIEALLADDALSADVAREQAGIDRAKGPAALPEQKFADAVVGNLGRLGAAHQKRHLAPFVRALKTDDVKRELRDLLNAELGEADGPEPAPRKVGVAQAADVLSDTVRLVNALLEGEGCEDEELEALRRRAQGVVFDIPEKATPATGAPGTLARRWAEEGAE